MVHCGGVSETILLVMKDGKHFLETIIPVEMLGDPGFRESVSGTLERTWKRLKETGDIY